MDKAPIGTRGILDAAPSSRMPPDLPRGRAEGEWRGPARAAIPPSKPAFRQMLFMTALLGCWFFVVGFSHSRDAAIVGDLAEYVNNPVRLLIGEIPYRDFWLLHPPGEVLFPAAIYALGFGMNSVLLASLAVNTLVGVATFVVVRPLVGSSAEAALAGVIVFFSGVPHDYGSFVCLQAYFLCLLVAAGFLIHHLEHPGNGPLFGAGLLIGLGSLFKLYLSGAAGAALFATILLAERNRGAGIPGTARSLGAFLVGALVAPAVMTACFAGDCFEFWHAIAFDSVSHATVLKPSYGHKLPEFWADAVPAIRMLRHDPFAWTTGGLLKLSRLIEMATMHAVPFLAGALWWYSWRKKIVPQGRTGRALLFFLLWGGLTFIRAFLRGGSTTSLTQATTPLFIVLVLLLWPLVTHARSSRASGAFLATAMTLAALAGLGQWSAALTIHEILARGRPSHQAVAPYGVLVTADRAEAAVFQDLINVLIENSAPSDHVFVTPWNAPPLYALTRRRNPTRYDSLIDLTHRPSEEKQRSICVDLLAHESTFVVHRPLWRTGSDSFEHACPLIDRCLRTHFEPFRDCGPYSVWRRKDRTDAGPAVAAMPRF